MSCTQTLNGIARDCYTSLGGVKRVLLANRSDVISIGRTNGIVTTITMAAGTCFKEYLLRRFSGFLESPYQTNDNGTRYVLSRLSMTFGRLESAKRHEVEAVAHSELAGIAEDMNGRFWLLGEDDPLGVADGTDASTGAQRTDLNGYTVVLEASSPELPPEVDPEIIAGLLQPAVTVEVYVQDLIDENYAKVVTGAHGNYVEIQPDCPYAMDQVVDEAEVALDDKELTPGTKNIIVWAQTLPSGWAQSDIVALYADPLSFTPRGGLFWAITDQIDTLEVTFAGGYYVTADYPWGSYLSEGVFAPRWNFDKEAEYAAKGFRRTPRTVIVHIAGEFSSVAQVMFTQMQTTENFTLDCGGVFVCHDVTGMFESNAMTNLYISGPFRWDAIRTCHNMFDGCANLLSIPYVEAWGRDSVYNTIYPRWDGVRGSADCSHLFRAVSLRSIGPRLNMNAVSLEGCTADGHDQAALSDALFNCPELTDVRIVNLGNNSWNFADASTKTYIPKMDAASIDYILNNIKDETGNGYSVTFSTLHQAEVSASAIAAAEAKGWTINFV